MTRLFGSFKNARIKSGSGSPGARRSGCGLASAAGPGSGFHVRGAGVIALRQGARTCPSATIFAKYSAPDIAQATKRKNSGLDMRISLHIRAINGFPNPRSPVTNSRANRRLLAVHTKPIHQMVPVTLFLQNPLLGGVIYVACLEGHAGSR